jgi:hypothetical protein
MNTDQLRTIIKEEVGKILKEQKTGGLLDTKNFDPVNPDVEIPGFGTMDRNSLRLGIVSRLEGILDTAKNAAKGGPMTYKNYENMSSLLNDNNVLLTMIRTEIAVADELETMRKRGGRRTIAIPKQY